MSDNLKSLYKQNYLYRDVLQYTRITFINVYMTSSEFEDKMLRLEMVS